MVADFKQKLLDLNERVALDTSWKPGGKTFIDSLPKL